MTLPHEHFLIDLTTYVGEAQSGKTVRARRKLDEDRILELRRLFDAGYGKQLLALMDICHKVHLTQYGGVGYDYLLRDFVPLLERREFDDPEIERLQVDNPRTALTPA
ncbi:MAG: hypothetical protein ABEH65_02900 [Halobacteriales archaeon]